MADGRAVRLLPDKCVRIDLKPRFCAARHVRIDYDSILKTIRQVQATTNFPTSGKAEYAAQDPRCERLLCSPLQSTMLLIVWTLGLSLQLNLLYLFLCNDKLCVNQ